MNHAEFDSAVYERDRVKLEAARVDARGAKQGDVVFCDGAYALVLYVREYPPGHPSRSDAPICSDMTAVEVVTTNGSRWFGR